MRHSDAAVCGLFYNLMRIISISMSSAAQEFEQEVLLNKENEYYLKWNFVDDYIDLHLSAKTSGWLGFGFSPNGGMDQSDVLFAFVDNHTGQANVTDRFITVSQPASVQLQLDKQQDWTLLSANRNATHLAVRVRRKLDTCDSMDRPITQDTMRVIFSLGRDQPVDYLHPAMHFFRGSRSLILLDKSLAVRKMGAAISPPIVKNWNVLVDAVIIPEGVTSMYHCELALIPEFQKKYQLVKTVPKIDDGNIDLVHHMMMYLCDDSITDSFGPKKFTCMTQNTSDPNLLPGIQLITHCATILSAWAVGGSDVNFPEEAGLPIGPELNGRFVYIEMHYNNPFGKRRMDSSGMNFQLTDKLRKYDVGIMTLGSSSFEDTMIIPPGAISFRQFGVCSDSCTRDLLPADGVSAFKIILHSHLLGRKLRVRHIRNNTELPVLSEDNHYDFNYQEARGINPVRKLEQGDQLIFQCEYSNNAPGNTAVFGGMATSDEMCFGVLYYYPKTNLSSCQSSYAVDTAVNFLAIPDAIQTLQALRAQQQRNAIGTDPTAPNGTIAYTEMDRYTEIMALHPVIRRALANFSWTPEKIQTLQNAYDTSDGFATCKITGANLTGPRFAPQSVLHFTPLAVDSGAQCSSGLGTNGQSNSTADAKIISNATKQKPNGVSSIHTIYTSICGLCHVR
ncbi:DBH-like monooxygenase protein 2 homolog [Paramacrobiotus metropolitanus]|uniref:DBH-like monooxygenase protein 2 homolog n=1 Tax=Paramacrobiotus metropolitanus TaxID=2943436 RepID=UPI002445FC98|nr:DBH-like monooxygenase protein 2 homolog [Paramacrobiotus metropolitanus]